MLLLYGCRALETIKSTKNSVPGIAATVVSALTELHAGGLDSKKITKTANLQNITRI